MEKKIKIWIRAERIEEEKGRIARVLEYPNGSIVKIPINKDGSIKWFDDSQLLKK